MDYLAYSPTMGIRTINVKLYKHLRNVSEIKRLWSRIYNRFTLSNSATSILLGVGFISLAGTLV